jgi:hypothetical protein
MKLIFTFSLFLLGSSFSHAQKLSQNQRKTSSNNVNSHLNGQWKGGFNENVLTFSSLDDGNTAYVLELNLDGTKVSGSSYTYFNSGGKKYYTICRLSGTFNPRTKEMVVTEVERTKSNTPPPPIFNSCLQVHRLHLEQQGDGTEVLRGTWESAPNQRDGCESGGATVLSKRMSHNTPLGIKPPHKSEIVKTAPKKKKQPIVKAPTKKLPPIIKEEPKEETVRSFKNPIIDTPKKIEEQKVEDAVKIPTIIPKVRYEDRRKDIVKTIKISEPTFRLDFYDNGEIDGDSISVFYNGKLVLSHQRLSDKPLSITLPIDKNVDENIVTMYAENLGTIPPNTAVMIVRDGSKVYEVRLESDLKKSASVIFIPTEK